jgi:hypothetical protein
MHVGGFRDDPSAVKYAFGMDMLERKDSRIAMDGTHYSLYSLVATSVPIGLGTSFSVFAEDATLLGCRLA